MRRIFAIVATLLCTALGMMTIQPASAHDWVPADGSTGHVLAYQHDSCDQSNEQWGLDDGGVWFGIDWFNHKGHVHLDHISTEFKQNFLNCNGTNHIYRISQIHIKVYGGVCDGKWPGCADGLGPVVADQWSPDATHANEKVFENFGDRYDYFNAFVVITYQVEYRWGVSCCDLSWAGRETYQMDG